MVFAEEPTSHSGIYKQETISSFVNDGQKISNEKELTDFKNNRFAVYEIMPQGHAIYSVIGEKSIFLEGSYEVNSPFFGHYNHEIYYVGPGDYYCVENGAIINLITSKTVSYVDIPHTYEIDPSFYMVNDNSKSSRASFPTNPDGNKTHVQDGFTVINNDDYFRNLTQFPDNTDGTCGLVSMCMLLGYFDNYVDQGFITSAGYVSGNGTTQAMHDYLFDNCLHTILGIGGDTGYPMAGFEIKESMKDYIANKCTTSLKNKIKHEYGSLVSTHATPRKHINGGYPTLLVMTSYNQSSLTRNLGEKDKNHVVVAYGYNKANDTFLAHMGWWPGYTTYTSRIISNATIHSYYTINYN